MKQIIYQVSFGRECKRGQIDSYITERYTSEDPMVARTEAVESIQNYISYYLFLYNKKYSNIDFVTINKNNKTAINKIQCELKLIIPNEQEILLFKLEYGIVSELAKNSKIEQEILEKYGVKTTDKTDQLLYDDVNYDVFKDLFFSGSSYVFFQQDPLYNQDIWEEDFCPEGL